MFRVNIPYGLTCRHHEQCDPRHPLRKLGERIAWRDFEEAFGEYYSEEGRPAKPVRLMVGLLLLKQMYDQSDEDVVERWVENPYWQQFCGMSDSSMTFGSCAASSEASKAINLI